MVYSIQPSYGLSNALGHVEKDAVLREIWPLGCARGAAEPSGRGRGWWLWGGLLVTLKLCFNVVCHGLSFALLLVYMGAVLGEVLWEASGRRDLREARTPSFLNPQCTQGSIIKFYK